MVTGLGVVSPIGSGKQDFWDGLQSGKNGIGPVTKFDVSSFRSKFAAEVKDFKPEDWIDRKSTKRVDRFTQFALAAATMAVEDASLNMDTLDKEKFGVVIGSGIGGSATIDEGYKLLQQKGPRGLTPFFLSKLLINMAASLITIKYGLKGPVSAPSVACSTGTNSIGDAARIIKNGDADVMLAGGSEACITSLAFGGFCAARSMSTCEDPDNASKPFDLERDGFVMGEGAGVVVLESYEHAVSRKAKIYAEVAGYGSSADAHHYTAPDPNALGMIASMKRAIDDAGIKTQDINYINAHGTSTKLNDKAESKAIKELFKDHTKRIKVSSTKSMIGHLMAAAGSVEFIASVLSMWKGIIPPTINYKTPDPECLLNIVTGNKVKAKINYALSNSFGFGGGNASIIIKNISG